MVSEACGPAGPFDEGRARALEETLAQEGAALNELIALARTVRAALAGGDGATLSAAVGRQEALAAELEALESARLEALGSAIGASVLLERLPEGQRTRIVPLVERLRGAAEELRREMARNEHLLRTAATLVGQRLSLVARLAGEDPGYDGGGRLARPGPTPLRLDGRA